MKQYFAGALHFHETEQGLVPLRYTNAQMQFFEPLIYKFRSYNAAGIRLDCVTDSPYISMSYEAEIKPDTTEQLHFDIMLEDQLIASPVQEVSDQAEGEWIVQLPVVRGNPKRVTVYLPYLAKLTIKDVKVAEGAIWEPAKPYDKNMLCLGDSITQGLSAEHPSATYAVLLSRFLGMNLLNQAVSGYVFNEDSIDPSLPYRPDLITVAYGTNDWKLCDSLEQINDQASRYIRKLHAIYPDTPIVIMSPLWREESDQSSEVGAFTAIHDTLYRLAGEYKNMTYVNGLELVPHQTDYYTDGLHPNDKGFLHMALNLLRHIKRQVKI